jgi:enoyl-CoA hydratase/carnithine racemase
VSSLNRRSWPLAWLRSRTRNRASQLTARFRGRRGDATLATVVVVESLVHGVLEIRLAGGERRNVLGRSTIDRIDEVVATPPRGTKVIVITAEPPDFCAGYDIVEASRGDVDQLMAHERNFTALRSSMIPIVIAMQGNVIGGGVELALLADVRIATSDVRFAIPASKLGLVYSETGAKLVVDAFGESVARSMFLGGRVVGAEQAMSMGVVSQIFAAGELRDEALKLAAGIASWSPLATSGNRQILDVITGRIEADTSALHQSSFARHGALADNIAEFIARSDTKSQRHGGRSAKTSSLPEDLAPSDGDLAPCDGAKKTNSS